MNFSMQELAAVERAIAARRTWKVIGDPANPIAFAPDVDQRCRTLVRNAVKAADAAPFHYDRNYCGVPQPWRVDILWHETCQVIAGKFFDWFEDIKPGNKLPGMLSSCGACVVVSWLPQFEDASNRQTSASDLPARSKQIQINQEHLAATSAYVQNLLLMLTASNMGTYWSSGGQFRQDTMKTRLGIDPAGSVLAAVFVDFQLADQRSTEPARERIAGKLANKRAAMDQWATEINIGDIR